MEFYKMYYEKKKENYALCKNMHYEKKKEKKTYCSIIPNIDYIKQKIRLAYQIEKKVATENSTLSKHLKKCDKISEKL